MASAAEDQRGRPRVVVVGAGFAGLRCARSLKRVAVDVVVIDRRNHHLFQPLLYQVATAALSPADIAAPIRTLMRSQGNARVVLGEVVGVDLDASKVELASGASESFDYLVLASGADVSYFGNEASWSRLAPGLKTAADALEIRERFLRAFELAEASECPSERAALLTFVVIGGGPTGVEIAGTMSEIARRSIPPDFARLKAGDCRVVLVEGGGSLLPSMPEELGDRAKRDLERLGVEVRLGVLAEKMDEGGVELSDGSSIEASSVFWAAGVSPSPLAGMLGVECAKDGRVPVGRDLCPAGHPEVFAVGDLAEAEDVKGRSVPGIAPAAMQMGGYAARRIEAEVRGGVPPKHEGRPGFRYRDKGMLATIGRGKAVGTIGPKRVAGVFAWLVWLFVHLFYLVGFRNRAVVLVQWAYAYVFWVRGARLIFGVSRGRGGDGG